MSTMQSPLPAYESCLSEDLVLAFHEGLTSAEERQSIHEHLDACDDCRNLVLVMARLVDGENESDNLDVQTDSSERLAGLVSTGFRMMTLREGSRVARRFDILRFVERGGMGEVYEAFDRSLGSRVALKTLLCTAADSSQALRRLCEEVNLARRVAHPNVCRIYDLHEHHEQQRPMHFLAMEFIVGETLKDRLLAGELTIAEACAIARQLLRGLGAVHAAGVLHLDFKSQNVMLRQGLEPAQAVVMDFSLSRAFEKELRLRTSERQLAGSIGYMSPEQLECQSTLGPASDVYAFGVVFFEMLTGRLPFDAESPTAVMLKQLQSRPVAPSSLRRGIGQALDAFVLTCLSRQPRARFQTMESALMELERCTEPDGRRPRERGRRSASLAVAAAVAVVLSGAVASYRSPSSEANDARALDNHAQAVPAAPPLATAVVEVEGLGSPFPVAERLQAPETVATGSTSTSDQTPPVSVGSVKRSPSKPAARPAATAPRPVQQHTAASEAEPSTEPAERAPPKEIPQENEPVLDRGEALPEPTGDSKPWKPRRAPNFLL